METDHDHLGLIPEQQAGSRMDAMEKRSAETVAEAAVIFKRACDRLLNVNAWGELAGLSDFQLIDVSGVRVERKVKEGDFIRIDIPGPGTMAGMGYDWVRVEEIKKLERDGDSTLGMRVRPSAHPISGSEETAHFLKDAATSTFIVKLNGREITAEEHGRNEMANTETESLLDKGRNFTVSLAAKFGLSYPQWKSLVSAFLAD
jgi:hypothetical protein